MGSVNAKPSSTRSRSYSNRQSFSLVSVIRGIMVALAASALPFLIIYTLPSLKFFLIDLIPSLWKYCSSELFTPRNLFVLLNLIILSIFAMAHLHSGRAAAASSWLQSRPASDDHADEISEDAINRSLSEGIKLDDNKSEDLLLVDEVESTNQQINDPHDRPTGHGAQNDDAADGDIQATNTGILVIKEVIRETHLQQADHYEHRFADHQIDKRKADRERKKAEKAHVQPCADQTIHEKSAAQAESIKAEKAKIADQQMDEKLAPEAKSKKAGKAKSISSLQGGNPLPDMKAYNIDSLLSEEGSIFTRVQSRPLPSARFTHKKATKLSGLDRPLSPLKMSRPILKRGDTFEATWKAICESKRHSSPFNRQHSRLITRKADNSEEIMEGIVMNSNELAKALPLKRRESSLELNAKVESFISRFNEQIRIQREKSLLDYMEMVGRGAN